jgi:hypothetical protein
VCLATVLLDRANTKLTGGAKRSPRGALGSIAIPLIAIAKLTKAQKYIESSRVPGVSNPHQRRLCVFATPGTLISVFLRLFQFFLSIISGLSM